MSSETHSDHRHMVLVYGPRIAAIDGAYGGGTGGYTRKMGLYLNHFQSNNFKIIPCFHTIRGQFKLNSFLLRFVIDIANFVKCSRKTRPQIVHILAQYRSALPREFVILLYSKLTRRKVVYEIKAGIFDEWYQRTNVLYRAMARYVLRNSDILLCQGQRYISFIKNELGLESHYYPNFVPSVEIPEIPIKKLMDKEIKVLFVGYATRDKGVFELVEACNLASATVPVQLTFVGKEHEEFSKWLDNYPLGANMNLSRPGLLPHNDVLDYMDKNEVYGYPTSHKGEGHNNSINEAMMRGLVIITTNAGFLGEILDDNMSYKIEKVDARAICDVLLEINSDRASANEKARNARNHLLKNFTSEIAFHKLEMHYSGLLSHSRKGSKNIIAE